MGTSRTSGEFSQKIALAGIAIGKAQTNAILRASLGVKTVMSGAVDSMTGGDGRLSGAGNRKVSVGFDMRPGTGQASSVMRARGPIMLVEADTPAHVIRPRSKSKSRRGRSGARAIQVAPGIYRASAFHPGTRGKRRWAKARDTAAPAVARREIVKANAAAIGKVFR